MGYLPIRAIKNSLGRAYVVFELTQEVTGAPYGSLCYLHISLCLCVLIQKLTRIPRAAL